MITWEPVTVSDPDKTVLPDTFSLPAIVIWAGVPDKGEGDIKVMGDVLDNCLRVVFQ
jgi:hypothetical protein